MKPKQFLLVQLEQKIMQNKYLEKLTSQEVLKLKVKKTLTF